MSELLFSVQAHPRADSQLGSGTDEAGPAWAGLVHTWEVVEPGGGALPAVAPLETAQAVICWACTGFRS